MERVDGNTARPWYSLNGINWMSVGDIFAATGFVGSYLGIYATNNANSLCAASFDRTRLGARCRADINSDTLVTVQDIFDFLAAWFARSSTGDFNGVGGVTVQDIFDFLAAWFAKC